MAYETYAFSGFELTIDIFHHMISSCRNALPLQPDKAVAILHEIRRTPVQPTVRTFNLVIEVCGLAKQWRKAVNVLPVLDHCGLVPTSCTFSCLSKVRITFHLSIGLDVPTLFHFYLHLFRETLLLLRRPFLPTRHVPEQATRMPRRSTRR